MGVEARSQSTIELREFSMSAFDELCAAVPDARFHHSWAGPLFEYPLERESFQAHLERAASAKPSRRCYSVHRPGEDRLIGYGEIGSISEQNRAGRLGKLLIVSSERGRGLGQQLVAHLLQVAFAQLALHRVELEVYDFNHAARRCYESAGLRLDGIRRESDRVGDEYWNSCIMSILEHEWREYMSPVNRETARHRGHDPHGMEL